MFNQREENKDVLLYGGIALGVVAGAVAATYMWKRRLGEIAASISPLERAEQLIESCENKLESIEQAIGNLKPDKSK